MNRLEKFRARGKKITLPGDEAPIEIKALTFSEMSDFATLMQKEDLKGGLNFMLVTTLKKAYPEMSEEEIQKEASLMDSQIAKDILEVVKEVSGLGDTEDKKKE